MKQFENDKEMLKELDDFIFKTKPLQGSFLRNKLISKINEFLQSQGLDSNQHHFVDTKKIARYKCDFCREHFDSIKEAKEHEITCTSNPVNKNCLLCKNHDYNVGDEYGEGFGFFCIKEEDPQVSDPELYEYFLDDNKKQLCPYWEHDKEKI